MNMPNRQKTVEMLKKMELVVAIDTMPSDTVMYADVVLPECTYLERTDPVKTFGGVEPAIAQRNKVIDPMYDSKPVVDIMRSLTRKLSKPMFEITKKYDEEVQAEIEDSSEEEVFAEFDINKPFQESQEMMNEHAVHDYHGAAEILKEKGVYYPNMDTYFKQISANEHQYYPEKKKYYTVNGGKPKTKSGKVECNLPNLATKGVDPMPVWNDDYEYVIPEGKYRMLTGRHAQFTQSGTANNSALRDLMMENYLWINKRVAAEKKIAFGDTIEVSSSAGSVTIKSLSNRKDSSRHPLLCSWIW